MNKKIQTLMIALLLGLSAAAFADDAQVVAAAYPQTLISNYVLEFQENGAPAQQLSDWRPLGKQLLVAAYTNGFNGAIRVLRRDGTVVFESSLRISGVFPRIDVVNLDGAGSDEVIASFSSARGRESNWVFRWTGATLQLIGPSAVDGNGDVYTTLLDAGWADLDGDGKLELYAPSSDPGDLETPAEPSTFEVFKLVGDHYVSGGSFLYTRTFGRVRNDGQGNSDSGHGSNDDNGRAPITTDSLLATPGVYQLRVVKETSDDGDDPKFTISINGAPITLAKHQLTAPVTLQESNTIQTTIKGELDKSFTVIIEPKP
jgi:hypothetical protein